MQSAGKAHARAVIGWACVWCLQLSTILSTNISGGFDSCWNTNLHFRCTALRATHQRHALSRCPVLHLSACLSICGNRSVPALMDSYRFCRTWGVVSSSSSLQRSWAATSTAAASGVPGSYLAFELSTSDDGWAWQPVRFRQSGFGGMSAGQEGLLGRLRCVYEPRLQGRLAAAGSGSLEDDAWLLGLADKVLEVRESCGGGWCAFVMLMLMLPLPGCHHCLPSLGSCCAGLLRGDYPDVRCC